MLKYFISWLCSFIYPLNGVYLELCTSLSRHAEEWDFDGYYLQHKSKELTIRGFQYFYEMEISIKNGPSTNIPLKYKWRLYKVINDFIQQKSGDKISEILNRDID
ncbi:hypothetical protein [Aggregatibacter actinomycetemcomitans]|uniref:hypothetical protein n=1 Tax=Aggregatibacter actinomycetemcomitans TaxID=714 RepID=UPI00215B4CEF|nr:hypothetical protein [Aggregatibacter actinomycetemcomitans]